MRIRDLVKLLNKHPQDAYVEALIIVAEGKVIGKPKGKKYSARILPFQKPKAKKGRPRSDRPL